jgi:hypothetical protein
MTPKKKGPKNEHPVDSGKIPDGRDRLPARHGSVAQDEVVGSEGEGQISAPSTNPSPVTTPTTKRSRRGVRVRFNQDVQMGNRDNLWTIPAGTLGWFYDPHDAPLGPTVRFDSPIGGIPTVYIGPDGGKLDLI